MWVKTNGIPFWGRCTTHFRTYFSGDWDVHWGYGLLTHGHVTTSSVRPSKKRHTQNHVAASSVRPSRKRHTQNHVAASSVRPSRKRHTQNHVSVESTFRGDHPARLCDPSSAIDMPPTNSAFLPNKIQEFPFWLDLGKQREARFWRNEGTPMSLPRPESALKDAQTVGPSRSGSTRRAARSPTSIVSLRVCSGCADVRIGTGGLSRDSLGSW